MKRTAFWERLPKGWLFILLPISVLVVFVLPFVLLSFVSGNVYANGGDQITVEQKVATLGYAICQQIDQNGKASEDLLDAYAINLAKLTTSNAAYEGYLDSLNAESIIQNAIAELLAGSGTQGAGSEIKSGSGSQSGSGTKVGSGSQSGSGTKVGSGSQSGSGTKVGSGSQSGSGTKSGSGSQSGSGTKSGSGSQSGSGTKSGSGSQSGSGTKSGSGSQSGSGTKSGSDSSSSSSDSSSSDSSSSDSSSSGGDGGGDGAEPTPSGSIMTWIGARDEWSLDGGDTSGWELTIKPSGTTELPTWHIFTTRVASESGDSVVVSVKKSFDNLGDITNTPVPSIAQFDKNGDSRINKQEAIDAVNNFLLNKHTEKEVAIVAVNGFLLQKGVAQLQVQLQQLWQQKIARIQSMVQSASKFNLSNTITLPKP